VKWSEVERRSDYNRMRARLCVIDMTKTVAAISPLFFTLQLAHSVPPLLNLPNIIYTWLHGDRVQDLGSEESELGGLLVGDDFYWPGLNCVVW
jgi:hypothetical protein